MEQITDFVVSIRDALNYSLFQLGDVLPYPLGLRL